MSGKSTLLRSVGINTVLAMAGAPVRAKSLRLSPLQVGTRIHSTDSLQEGRSTFFAEILHIRSVFDLAGVKCNKSASAARTLLFLFDELLEGTNSNDRRIGAESLIQALLEAPRHRHRNHARSRADGNRRRAWQCHAQHALRRSGRKRKMQFDYKLREGVVTKSNAIALMRIIGLETGDFSKHF